MNYSKISKLKKSIKDRKNKSIDSSLFKKSRDSNCFKYTKNMKTYLLQSEKLKLNKKFKNFFNITDESSQDNKAYKLKRNYINFLDSKNKLKNFNNIDFEIKKNLNKRFKDIIAPFKGKKRKVNFSYEKVFHSSIMNEENDKFDKPNKMIITFRKMKKKNKLPDNKTINKNKDPKFYDKFINKKPLNYTNIKTSNYSDIYLKKLLFNDNKNNYDYDEEKLNIKLNFNIINNENSYN